MWLALLGPLPQPEWFGNGAKLLYIVAVRLTGALLGNIFLWSGSVFYPDYRPGQASWDLTPLQDQGAAGTIMMIESSIVTVVLLGWLFVKTARESEERQELLELASARGLELSERRAARAVASGRGDELRRRLERARWADAARRAGRWSRSRCSAGCDDSGDAPRPRPQPQDGLRSPEGVMIRDWLMAVKHGDYGQAATFFAPGAIIDQGRPFRLREPPRRRGSSTPALPCHADLVALRRRGRQGAGHVPAHARVRAAPAAGACRCATRSSTASSRSGASSGRGDRPRPEGPVV